MSFQDLGLSPDTLRAIEDIGYTEPTPIQAQAIPVVLKGRDVLGIAQTGTGKTAGFTLPMIDILASGRAKARMPRSLILEPTRELAAQVGENFDAYGKYQALTCALLIGGERFDEQIRKLDRGVDVLIATPGRMIDLYERGKVLLADTKILVIDEADRMLDMGFIPDIERIVSLLPRRRQTLFFSATMPTEIRGLADKFLHDPEEIAVAPPASVTHLVEQFVLRTNAEAKSKRASLRAAIRQEEPDRALIFCNRKRDVSIVFRSLLRHGFEAGELHGDMAQPARTATLERFRKSEIHLLVCSDVAARGIDIQELSHVINYDVPHNAEDYVHRIGRTGRAGRTGRSITLVAPDDRKAFHAVETLTGRKMASLEVVEAPAPLSAEVSEAPKKRRADTGAKRKAGPKPAAGKAPSADPPKERPEKVPAQAPRRRRASQEPEEPVLGMGDHVPAFLLRPARSA